MINEKRLNARFSHLMNREATKKEMEIMTATSGSMADKLAAVKAASYITKTPLVIDACHCCDCK